MDPYRYTLICTSSLADTSLSRGKGVSWQEQRIYRQHHCYSVCPCHTLREDLLPAVFPSNPILSAPKPDLLSVEGAARFSGEPPAPLQLCSQDGCRWHAQHTTKSHFMIAEHCSVVIMETWVGLGFDSLWETA